MCGEFILGRWYPGRDCNDLNCEWCFYEQFDDERELYWERGCD